MLAAIDWLAASSKNVPTTHSHRFHRILLIDACSIMSSF
jgi:hypothetical protein